MTNVIRVCPGVLVTIGVGDGNNDKVEVVHQECGVGLFPIVGQQLSTNIQDDFVISSEK